MNNITLNPPVQKEELVAGTLYVDEDADGTSVYILAQFRITRENDILYYALISLQDGNRFSDPVPQTLFVLPERFKRVTFKVIINQSV